MACALLEIPHQSTHAQLPFVRYRTVRQLENA
jgi:hypothetical protein